MRARCGPLEGLDARTAPPMLLAGLAGGCGLCAGAPDFVGVALEARTGIGLGKGRVRAGGRIRGCGWDARHGSADDPAWRPGLLCGVPRG